MFVVIDRAGAGWRGVGDVDGAVFAPVVERFGLVDHRADDVGVVAVLLGGGGELVGKDADHFGDDFVAALGDVAVEGEPAYLGSLDDEERVAEEDGEERGGARFLDDGVDFESVLVDPDDIFIKQAACLGVDEEHDVLDIGVVCGQTQRIFDRIGWDIGAHRSDQWDLEVERRGVGHFFKARAGDACVACGFGGVCCRGLGRKVGRCGEVLRRKQCACGDRGGGEGEHRFHGGHSLRGHRPGAVSGWD